MNQSAAQANNSVGTALAHARQLLASHPGPAAQQAREIIRVEPGIAEAHLILASALRRLGDEAGGYEAEREALHVSTSDPVLKRAAELLADGRLGESEALLRRFFEDTPNDPEALRLMAQVAASGGHLERAEQLVRRTLGVAPSFEAAKLDLKDLIEQQARAYTGTDAKPETPPEGTAEFEHAIEAKEKSLTEDPGNPKLWLSYGHVLRIAGRQEESVSAYRKAVELEPGFGEGWWSLADLKTVQFTSDDIARMNNALKSKGLGRGERTGILFALGKAFGDAGQFEQSFGAYAEGNALKRPTVSYDTQTLKDHVRQCEGAFTREFFKTRFGQGCQARDPIFIVGMNRSGSTLVEQILASHPSIEGTEELVYIGNLANLFADGRRAGLEASPFVTALCKASPESLDTIGRAYMWKVGNKRHSSRPYFIDKMPRNWMYLPMILLALPNARIIDVRRHPMDCCWSNFRQLFADSGEFSYDLKELGNYYRDYVRMMQHLDVVLPKRIHRVFYEQLVSDPEGEVRRMLDYIGVPFDQSSLRFHNNPRAVKTSSSEQVRKPISDEGIDQWRSYDRWLKPLEQALGEVVPFYPEVPETLDS